MAGVLEEAWFPCRVAVEEESVVSSNPTDAVAFVAISLVLGIACRHLLRGTRVPYTVALLIIGVGLGSLEHGTSRRLGRIGNGIRLWENIDPDLLLAVFLPALLFESSFSMEMHQIKKCMAQMILLAGPGVLISTFFLGSVLKYTFPYNWSWKISLLLGGLLSATDPVAVVALLKELGASKKLNTIIEGESLMNDGTAIVIYQLFFRMVLGQNFNFGTVVKYLTQASLGAVGIGVAFAIASVWWLRHIFNDTVIEITLTLAVSYLAYFTGQEWAAVSGVLTVMTLGMFYASVARTSFKGDSQKSLHHFWEMVSYLANTLIFILSGVVIAEGVLSSANIFEDNGNLWGYLILLYVLVQISRILVVGMLYPFLQYFGYGLNWKEGIILVWSGLRGAVALSLSLSVKRSSYGSSRLSSETGTLFVFFTGGIVFLTLIVNGSTTQFLLHVLGMDKLSAAKRRVLDYTKYEMQRRALEAFGDVGDDELGPADWSTVKKYISTLNDVEGTQLHPHSVSESGINLDHMNLKDTRIRLLNGVQAAYWEMLNEGRVGRTTATLLIQSVDEAIDLVHEEPLCDWKGLKSNVRFPGYYKFLRRSIFPEKLITYFAVERLESACCICAAFLRAHRIAQQQLYNFIGESQISFDVIRESKAEEEEPRRFLDDVRCGFPQVLCVVKTRQVTYSVLKHLIDYIQSLESVGLLEEKEMLHLHDAVQADLKKLLGNPPLVEIAKRGELISSHPLFGALPSIVHTSLEGSTKEFVEPRGTILYQEGSNPKGIWLISNGVVKTSRHKHSLHPVFLHGSTLGLYEVLSEKPYICDMITDSLARCFFVEIDKKMLSLLRSNPEVEEFLWQESVIVLSKLLLPHIFEMMTMLDLRVLVDTSRMTMYIHTESIEIPHHSIGFLLEGYIKSQGAVQELITSPAALLPTYGTQSSQNIETSGSSAGSFTYHGSQYIADSRARVIVFDMAAHDEVENAIQRRKSSFLLLNSADHPPRSRSREHIGLMSWPELAYKQRQHIRNSGYTGSGTKSMSEKAIQLSIFGSVVSGRPHPRNVPPRIRDKPSHSKSYPRVPSNQAPLVSVQSEGSSTLRSLTVRSFAGQNTALPSQCPGTRLIPDHSSDESGGEDEHIMCIDSPSNISFH